MPADARICGPPGRRRRIVKPGLKLYVADEKSHGVTADIDPLAMKCATQQAAAARELARLQGRFSKALGPVGHERGMGRAGHRIPWHPPPPTTENPHQT